MSNIELEIARNLLDDFAKLPKLEVDKTLIEILGFSSKEDVYTRMLKFFFDKNNNHNLQNLILESLIKGVRGNTEIIKEIKENILNEDILDVQREYFTENKKRIDLLIETTNYIIVIENKIYAGLYNDLKEYCQAAKNYSKGKGKRNFLCILLTLNQLNDSEINYCNKENFYHVTYSDFINNLKDNFFKCFKLCQNKSYIDYLKDFILTIEKNKSKNMNKAMLEFIGKNYTSIIELEKQRNSFIDFLNGKIERIKGLTENNLPEDEMSWIRIWIYERYGRICLVVDFKISDNDKDTIAIDTTYLKDVDNPNSLLLEEGWQIQLFGRGEDSKRYLFEKMCKTDGFFPESKKVEDYKIINDRLIYFSHSIDFGGYSDVEEVSSELTDLIKRIITTYKTIEKIEPTNK